MEQMPQWLKDWEALPDEERRKSIDDRREHILSVLPVMKDFFVDKFGDDLDYIKIKEKGVHYAYEKHSVQSFVMVFYFNNPPQNVKREVLDDIKNFFSLDITYYGFPLDVEFYYKKWEKL